MANLLNNYKQQSIVSKADYMNFLRQYTKLHYRVNQNNVLNLQEDYYPDKAGEIVGLSRSHHYFHSGYVDLIMNGLVGIRPRADDVIEVKEKSRQLPLVLLAIESPERDVPDYLDVNLKKMQGIFKATPKLADVPYPVTMEPNLVIEFYSR